MCNKIFKIKLLLLISGLLLLGGCGGYVRTGDIVHVEEVSGTEKVTGFGKQEQEALNRLRESNSENVASSDLETISNETLKVTIEEYLSRFHDSTSTGEVDYRVGGGDVLNIYVYDEPDLTRNGLRIARDGTISLPLLGRRQVTGLTTTQIEELIAEGLAAGQFLLDAQVSVVIDQYGSKKYQVLGEIWRPGSYPLKAEENLLDAISAAGGIDIELAGKELMVVRNVKQKKLAAAANRTQPGEDDIWGRSPVFNGEDSPDEKSEKIVILIELKRLLRGNDLISNLFLHDNDVIYIPKAEFFYIMGEVKNPGSYKFTQNDLTLVGALGNAGGFTNIAARKKTRIIRVEDGLEKIITVNVDAITSAGRKIQDVLIKPNDIIIVPQSFF